MDDVLLAGAAHLVEFLVEDDGRQEGDELVDGLPFVQGKLGGVAAFNQFGEVILADLREELVLSIVMMDAVAEEDAFGVHHEVLEIIAVAVALIGVEHRLDGLTDAEVVLEVLVEQDVASAAGSLA